MTEFKNSDAGNEFCPDCGEQLNESSFELFMTIRFCRNCYKTRMQIVSEVKKKEETKDKILAIIEQRLDSSILPCLEGRKWTAILDIEKPYFKDLMCSFCDVTSAVGFLRINDRDVIRPSCLICTWKPYHK